MNSKTNQRVVTHCKPIDSVILSARVMDTPFTQKTTFCFHSSYTAITSQTSIAPNHSVTWNDGRVWVLAASIGYRTGRIRMPDLNRNFGVGSDLTSRDSFIAFQDLDLELGPLKRVGARPYVFEMLRQYHIAHNRKWGPLTRIRSHGYR